MIRIRVRTGGGSLDLDLDHLHGAKSNVSENLSGGRSSQVDLRFDVSFGYVNQPHFSDIAR